MQADILAAVAALIRTARWYESRAEHPGSRFIRKATMLRISAMNLLRGVRGYRLRGTQMELPYAHS